MTNIDTFTVSPQDGYFGFLSNYYMVTSRQDGYALVIDGYSYKSVEHYYQAQKYVAYPALQQQILNAPGAMLASKLGRDKNNPPLPSNWSTLKLTVMQTALAAKFSIPSLKTKLLATGTDTLVLSSTTDTFWGNAPTGSGTDTLATMLMALRATLTA